MAAKKNSTKNPGAKRLGRMKDLPSTAIDVKKAADVRGGRRVDFTEAYVVEIKLPSLDSKGE